MTRRDFGTMLRRERERGHITLQAIAERTKISTSLLADLERGNCSKWPPGIYSRAWIRDYAQAIGLDPDQTAAEFAQCFAQTAFPGEPEKKTAPPVAAPPLRLTLDEAPRQRVREATKRGFLLTVDTVAAVLLASLTALTGYVGLWLSLSVMLIAVHALGVLSGEGTATGFFLHLLRDRRTPEPEPSRESAFAEAA